LKRKVSLIIAGAGIVLTLVGLIALYYAIYPTFSYRVAPKTLPYKTNLFTQTDNPDKFKGYEFEQKEIPQENRLVIPKIQVNAEIVEGEDESVLWDGVWRHPESAVPGEKGNTAFAGHRYQFKPPHERSFYNIDKLERGDIIIVYWESLEYDYEVESKFVVTPDAVEIIEKGDEEKLTIYSCTPLFTQENRLVIEAFPTEF
jgi:sortase A